MANVAGGQVSYAIKAAGETLNQIRDALPEFLDNNLGLALYGILALGAIAVFGYILWTLKPLFEIGANVSEK
jgi:nitrate reductase NapE component